MKIGKLLLLLGLVFGFALGSSERASAGLTEEQAAKKIQRAYRKYRAQKKAPPHEYDLVALLNKFLPPKEPASGLQQLMIADSQLMMGRFHERAERELRKVAEQLSKQLPEASKTETSVSPHESRSAH